MLIVSNIIILGLLSIIFYQNAHHVTKWFKQVFTRKKRVSNVDCKLLEQRVAELEKKVAKRANNDRAAIRNEIKNVLIELKQK